MLLRRRNSAVGLACALAIGLALPFSAAPSEAASCRDLRGELRQLTSNSGSVSPAAKKWTNALRQQKKALFAAERDASYFNCGSVSDAQCKTLNRKIKKMRSNLGAIERQVAKAGGGQTKNTKRIRQVRSLLNQQGCNAPETRSASRTTGNENELKPRSFFSRLFNPNGVQLAAAEAGDNEIASARRQLKKGRERLSIPSGGTFRTLCVRTCDGYFFPVSFSTGKGQFANDAARCGEICPASPTELYVYRNPGGNAEDMMSLAGDLYSEQPFAHRYKSEFVENCSCRLSEQAKRRSGWSEVSMNAGNRLFIRDISGGLPNVALKGSFASTYSGQSPQGSPLARTPLTRDQLPLFEDPDTLTNLEKGFDVTAALSEVRTRLQGPEERMAGLQSENSLPLLASRRSDDDAYDPTGIPPVFKIDNPDFRPAPDRDIPVRVVGPEYFVAQ